MKFERGQDPRKTMDIGARKIAVEVLDVVEVSYDKVLGHSNGMRSVSLKKTHELFKQLSSHRILSRERYRELRMYYRPRKANPEREQISWFNLLGELVFFDGELYRIPILKAIE